jgi:hypothetical protein
MLLLPPCAYIGVLWDCFTLNIITVIKPSKMLQVVYVASIGAMRNEGKILVRKHRGKRLFRRPRSRWKNNIKINFSSYV